MKKTQEHYTFEEYNQHSSLWNAIPAGDGNSLVYLRSIVDGIQSGILTHSPSILISGDIAEALAVATANTLCSDDIRVIDAKYLSSAKTQMDFFDDNLSVTVSIITNINKIGMAEGVLWQFLKNRRYKFKLFNEGEVFLHLNGILILTTEGLKNVSPPIISGVDYRVLAQNYTSVQLQLLVHQRLAFCGIGYGDTGKVLEKIVEYGNYELQGTLDFLKICTLLLVAECAETLDLNLVEQAKRLV
jgi:hypothetical protein